MLGDIILDVFPVGHCLFGCQSCGENTHRIPTYFTRYAKNVLPYTTQDIQNNFIKQKKSDSELNILICPSVGPMSFLSSPMIIDTLVTANKQANFASIVKLHGFCFLKNHPLSGISQLEGMFST